ncbi:hypothetical protein FACS1894217_03540 [Clostridia bacterium]|nr:hypothetical protein FACS1894217_03540 [Clostridia bacterium]
MGRRIMAMVVALGMVLSVGTISVAVEAATPLWANVNATTASISFSGGNAGCTVTIIGKTGTTSISATCTLQRKVGTSYTTVGSWSASSSSQTLSSSKSYAATSGQTYRLSVTAKVTKSGTVENISFTSPDYTRP